MARKPESTFTASVDRHIPEVYSEKMSNPWRGGTADKWYTGLKGDVWIEYKWISATSLKGKPKLALSALQRKWLTDRLSEGRKVAVVVGCAQGGWIFADGTWLSAFGLSTPPLSRKEIAKWILSKTGVSPCKLKGSRSLQATSCKRRIKAS